MSEAWHRLSRRGRLLGRRLTGNSGAFVLLYHCVDRRARDPWGLTVSPERFAEQLAVLRSHAHPMSLEAFAQARLARTLPRNAVAVTFDDGYADNLHNARPLLERFDIPATVFLATGYAGRGLPFWWDEVERLLLGTHELPDLLELDGGRTALRRPLAAEERKRRMEGADRGWRASRGDADPRQRLFLELWEWFAALDRGERASALRQLAGAVDAPREERAPRGLTAAEVGDLVAGGLVQVGAHTVSHPSLPSLPVDEQRTEIVQSRADVERLSGRPATTFSYPHGQRDEATERMVREAGFSVACTSGGDAGSGDCARQQRSDGLHLPRVSVHDWGTESFRRKLLAGFEA